MILIFLIIACSKEDDKIKNLDKRDSLGPIVLGDSLYSDILSTKDEYLNYEHKYAGHKILAHHDLTVPNFNYIQYKDYDQIYFRDYLINSVFFTGIDNNIISGIISIKANKNEIDSLKKQFIKKFGGPTSITDSLITREMADTNVTYSFKGYSWKGSRRSLSLNISRQKNGKAKWNSIAFTDKQMMELLDSLENELKISIEKGNKLLDSLTKFGKFDFELSRKEAVRNNIVEEESYSYKNSIDYKVNYKKYLAPFFDGLGYEGTDSGTIHYSGEGEFEYLSIYLDDNNFNEVARFLGERYGKYNVLIKSKKKENKDFLKRAAWISEKYTIALEEANDDYYKSILRFYLND